MHVVMCVPHTQCDCLQAYVGVLSRDSLAIIAYVPPNLSIKWKIFGSKQVFCVSNS